MEFRSLTINDREAVKALFRDVFMNAPWFDDWSDEDRLDAYIDDLAGQSNSLSLGYFEGGALAALALGCIRHWQTGTEYHIDEFCVARNRQGQGVGSAFLAEIEAYLARIGIRRFFLQTDVDMPAYGFYARRGFRELTGHVSFAKEIE